MNAYLNKKLQFMSEKIGGAKGTELDEEFTEMERVCIYTCN